MSVQSEITRLTSAKSAIATSIENKGVTVPSGTSLDGMSALIDNIPTGKSFPNGTEWTKSNYTSNVVYHVKYANGVWVAATNGNGLYYSTDGKIWTASNVTGKYMKYVEYGDGVWVAGGSSYVYYSTDGKIWTDTGFNNRVEVIKYANGLWVLGVYGGNLYYSTDGMTWTESVFDAPATISGNGYWQCIDYGRGVWVAARTNFSNYTTLRYSTDGMTWYPITVSSSSECVGTCYSVKYANGIWVAGASYDSRYTSYSTDGKTWTASNLGYSAYVEYGNGMWVTSSKNAIYYSQDGKTWTAADGTTEIGFLRIRYANGIWIAATTATSYAGAYYSTDGKTWAKSNIEHATYYAEYANGIWVLPSGKSSTGGLYYSVGWEPS